MEDGHGCPVPLPGLGRRWRGQGAEGLRVRGVSYAAFGEDGVDVTGGGYVEGWVGGGDVGGDSNALEVGYFVGGALFYGDVVAIGDGEVESRNRGGDVEGDVVFFGQDGDLVGADFVGGVTVGGDAIGAGYDGADFSRLQEVTHHVVGDQGEGDAAAVKLPGGQARALEIGARFGD